MDPEAFRQLDRVIHEKGRLAIMSLLAANPELSYTDLRALLQMTDGNLTTHLRTLQEAGYVVVNKSTFKNRPLTTLALSEAGRRAFADYLNVLEKIVQETRAAAGQTEPPNQAGRTA
jgi:DNA-binding MarR family transcriptional regulator